MYKKYLINVQKYRIMDIGVNNFYIFEKKKISVVKDILFLENRYRMMINNNLKE